MIYLNCYDLHSLFSIKLIQNLWEKIKTKLVKFWYKQIINLKSVTYDLIDVWINWGEDIYVVNVQV